MAGYGTNYGYGTTQTTANSMIAFINEDNMAVNYPVAPNTTVALINVNDPNNGKMFIKSTEPNGMPNPMRVFAIKEITPQKQSADVVSRQEFEKFSQSLGQQLQGLQQALAGLQTQPQQINQAKGDK